MCLYKGLDVFGCCGRYLRNFEKFTVKGKFRNKPYVSGERVVTEFIKTGLCSNCGERILQITHITESMKIFKDDPIRGRQASELFLKIQSNLRKLPDKEKKIFQTKFIPFKYYKSDDGLTQYERYIDESGNTGRIVEPALITN